jgi:hypothetical protein
MSYTIYNKATGEIERVVQCDPEMLAVQFDANTQAAVAGAFSDADFYVAAGTPTPKPVRPSEHHTFNWGSKTWVDARTIGQFKRDKMTAIEAERMRRIVAPIEYRGVTLDADRTAQTNISNKLLEIEALTTLGQDMPAPLRLWRDYHNRNHTFETTAEYKQWLSGLAVALSQRGTEAYAWAWRMKAQLDACTTPDEVQSMELK